MLNLPDVTMIGVDSVDAERLRKIMDICLEQVTFGAVKLLTHIDIDYPYVTKVQPVRPIEAYSEFMIRSLSRYVDTPFALVVQYDGFVLNADAWSDEFLAYDYIGAPWIVTDGAVASGLFPQELYGKRVVGNGGFSLRSKRFLDTCAALVEQGAITSFHPEDAMLCVRYRELLEGAGMRFAPASLAAQFSFEAESDERNAWNGQFGFHGLRWTDISRWLAAHPEHQIDNRISPVGEYANLSNPSLFKA